MFDWKHGIAPHPMQGIWASSPATGDVSWGLSSSGGTWVIFSSYSVDGPAKLHFLQQSQDSCLVRTDTSGI